MARLTVVQYLDAARAEVAEKTQHQIQVETALRWAARAIAATEIGRLDDAHEYAHEAVEHGALAGDETLRAVRAAFSRWKIAP